MHADQLVVRVHLRFRGALEICYATRGARACQRGRVNKRRSFVTRRQFIRRECGSIVDMPVYRGCDEMNSEAEGVWRGLGYGVRRVDCTSSFRHFGSLHCLVNVLER